MPQSAAKIEIAKRLEEDLGGLIAFNGSLMPAVIAIFLSDSFDSKILSFAVALISAVSVGLSLRSNGDYPTLHNTWHQVTLCLSFGALAKLLLDFDIAMLITVPWWIGFISVSLYYLARSCTLAQTMRELLA